ncbi:MAG: radical SAM protein [Planctomycetes bacterium]|nr:radical SAM protein [Planctomycetota bacterium]
MSAALAHRSPVPDLLFEDERDARVDEIRHLLEKPEQITEHDPLHRVTVFLTYRCNLVCPYCKTIARSEAELQARPEKRITYSLEDFRTLLDGLGATPVRHLHFTGGEASLVRGLPEMIRLAKARGVERVSMTSNGTRAPEIYLEALAAGLDELRISLDAADAALGQRLSGRPQAWEAAVRTIGVVAEARRHGAAAFLIVNTVVTPENRARLPEILAFVLALDPDDVKLITSVDAKEGLGDFPEAARVRAGLAAALAPYPLERFPLLRRKLETVFASDAIGLPQRESSNGFRCYVPLTERTVDGRFYYPCSVYLREGGAPLGRIDEPQDLQRAQTAAFVKRADCLSDPICKRYCLHCTRNYNLAANEAR